MNKIKSSRDLTFLSLDKPNLLIHNNIIDIKKI